MVTYASEIAHWPALALETLQTLPNFAIATLAALPDESAIILRQVIADERLSNLEFEHLLTSLRRSIREQVAMGISAAPVRPLLCGLAIQGYRHGYPFQHAPGEDESSDPLMRACYAPLEEELPEDGDPWIEALNRVHIREPLRQDDLVLTPKSLGPVMDAVSRRVRAQYEEHPYPHWWRQGITNVAPERTGTMLVAGCGTGQQPIGLAQHFPNMQITAVDLSRASLGYAMMRAEDFGITNIDWVHGDLLDIGRLGKTFDTITCVGVLHHMRDPAAGLKALAAVLKPGGDIKFAVYPKSSRGSVVAGIALRGQLRVAPTPDGIRAFRQVVASLPPQHAARKLAKSGEFYSLQSCRDMVFDEQEHRFDMPMLKALIAGSDLEFVLIQSAPKMQEMFRNMFPGRAVETDLDAWQEFEAKYPGCFRNFYRVIMRKPA